MTGYVDICTRSSPATIWRTTAENENLANSFPKGLDWAWRNHGELISNPSASNSSGRRDLRSTAEAANRGSSRVNLIDCTALRHTQPQRPTHWLTGYLTTLVYVHFISVKMICAALQAPQPPARTSTRTPRRTSFSQGRPLHPKWRAHHFASCAHHFGWSRTPFGPLRKPFCLEAHIILLVAFRRQYAAELAWEG